MSGRRRSSGARVTVTTPATIQRVTCFQGYEGSTEPCARATSDGAEATFRPGRELSAFEGLTVVVAIPKGAVPEPEPILEERWSAERAFSVNRGTIAGAVAVTLLLGGLLGRLWSREGRDRRYQGSPIDQVMGTPSGESEAVPVGEGDAEAPVEFAPPENVRPGQIGTLIDERANVIDVTATIVDLAGRGYLLIQEIPKEGCSASPTGRSSVSRRTRPTCSPTRSSCSMVSSATATRSRSPSSRRRSPNDCTASRSPSTHDADATEVVPRRPDQVRTRWAGRGVLLAVAGAALTFVLARWTALGARRDPRDRRAASRSR